MSPVVSCWQSSTILNELYYIIIYFYYYNYNNKIYIIIGGGWVIGYKNLLIMIIKIINFINIYH